MAIKRPRAWGTEIMFGMFTGTQDARLVNGNEAVGKTVSPVSWQLQHRLAGSLPVSKGLTEETTCPSGDSAETSPPRGSILLILTTGLWEAALKGTDLGSMGQNALGNPS